MSGQRKMTREELNALQAEVRTGAGDWDVRLTEIDGIPAEQYVPADEEGHAMTTTATQVTRKHGSMPRWAVLGAGRDSSGRLRLYWPWWSDINGERFLTRFIVIRNRWVTLEITRIHMADNQREHPHDHSHGFLSWIFGRYAEDVYYDPDDLSVMRHIRHRRFGIHRLRYTQAHSITEVSPGLWTILLAGPVKQTSSYWTPAGKRSTGVNGDQESWA